MSAIVWFGLVVYRRTKLDDTGSNPYLVNRPTPPSLRSLRPIPVDDVVAFFVLCSVGDQ